MCGIEGEFGFEFFFRVVVLMRLPEKIAKAEVEFGLARRDSCGSLKFGNGFGSFLQAIEGLTEQDVPAGRIRILLEDGFEFAESAVVVLGFETALSEHLTKLGVGRGLFDCRREKFHGFREAPRAVVADTEQNASLRVA